MIKERKHPLKDISLLFTPMAPTYLLILLLTVEVFSDRRELLVEEEIPGAMHNFASKSDDVADDNQPPCHMEYQVVKRVVGHCIRMGRSARGCVAGNYLSPFHPECV